MKPTNVLRCRLKGQHLFCDIPAHKKDVDRYYG